MNITNYNFLKLSLLQVHTKFLINQIKEFFFYTKYSIYVMFFGIVYLPFLETFLCNSLLNNFSTDFSNPKTQAMLGIMQLYDYIMFFLILILILKFVFFFNALLLSTVYTQKYLFSSWVEIGFLGEFTGGSYKLHSEYIDPSKAKNPIQSSHDHPRTYSHTWYTVKFPFYEKFYDDAYVRCNLLSWKQSHSLEFFWTIFPSFILVLMGIPSFLLLYSLEESSNPIFNISIIGNQWYWTYEYLDFDLQKFFTLMVSSKCDFELNCFRDFWGTLVGIIGNKDDKFFDADSISSFVLMHILFCSNKEFGIDCPDLSSLYFDDFNIFDFEDQSSIFKSFYDSRLTYKVFKILENEFYTPPLLSYNGSFDMSFKFLNIGISYEDNYYYYHSLLKEPDSALPGVNFDSIYALGLLYSLFGDIGEYFADFATRVMKNEAAGSILLQPILPMEDFSLDCIFPFEDTISDKKFFRTSVSLADIMLKESSFSDFENLFKYGERGFPRFLNALEPTFYYKFDKSLSSAINNIDNTISVDSQILVDSDLPFGYPRLLSTDQVLVIPSETTIRFLITSNDVIHSWSVPSFGVKIDAVPGRINQVILKTPFFGSSWGQCSELCGVNHGFMPIELRVLSLGDFNYYIKLIIRSLIEFDVINFFNNSCVKVLLYSG